jgi:hypothetical protein
MEDVDNQLNDHELYSSCHLRSNFEASHSLAPSTLPSLNSFSHSSLEAWEILTPSINGKKQEGQSLS